MKVNAKGLALIKHFEGLFLEAYIDPVGVWTIGYGHTKNAKKGMKITEGEAEALLREDLSLHEAFVESHVSISINDDEFSALVSFAFNVGNGALKSSTLLQLLNSGKKRKAAEQFDAWVKGTVGGNKVTLPGLVRRREAERKLFESGELDFGYGPVKISEELSKKSLSLVSSDALAMSGFKAKFDTWTIKHFSAHELLVKGYQNSNSDSDAYGLNTDPPEELWDNIITTIRVLDLLREQLGVPIMTTSVYRSPAYNKAIGGAKNSLHMEFNAIDFIVKNTTLTPSQWASRLQDMKAAGVFDGWIGVYDHFVHLDTRGNLPF